MTSTSYSPAALASHIDHTLLKPEAQARHIDKLCDEALEYGFASACVNSRWISRVAERLRGSSVRACSVVGFPLGASLPEAAAGEARAAVDAGAGEIDMVMSIGDALDGDWAAVAGGIAAVKAACGEVALKVILETCLLDQQQKRRACEVCCEVGVAFVKTSSGFSTGGATTADVAMMRAVVGPGMGVKAAGGIRDRQTAIAMLEAGADRLGCSAGVAIVTGGEASGTY